MERQPYFLDAEHYKSRLEGYLSECVRYELEIKERQGELEALLDDYASGKEVYEEVDKAFDELIRETEAREEKTQRFYEETTESYEKVVAALRLFKGVDYYETTFSQAKEVPQEKYCICQNLKDEKMIMCEMPTCKYGWYHFSCVNLKKTVKGKWVCPLCKEALKKASI